jgi:NadR type nicotinamide-nucleotide adenylyltransferase
VSVLRVAILGAESSGKSTLAQALAERYQTLWVPEYLREFVEVSGRVPNEEDQFGIARTQREREDAAAQAATGFLFCDTTPMMTAIYSRWYWGRVDAGLAALDAAHPYQLTVVTAPDGPWMPDGLQRESPEVRQRVHEQLLAVLEERKIGYTQVAGTLDERLAQVAELLRV